MADRTHNSEVSPFDALLEAAVDAIIIIDSAGCILRFNPAAERMFGFDEKEIRGSNVRRLMPEPMQSQHDAYLRKHQETGEVAIIGTGREVTALKKSGETFPVQLSVGEVRQGVDESRYVGILRDLSEVRSVQEQVRTLEEQLLHADRLVILGELTAGIAHEINQPLTAIAAYADAGHSMIERHSDTPKEDMQSICERIGEQSRRAAQVVQRLRELTRSGVASKSSHDINQTIRNILLLFDHELKKNQAQLVFVPLDPARNLYVDEIQIQQILVNLVKNSLDALAEATPQEPRVEIRVTEEEGMVRVEVTDNGPGVTEEVQHRLFESFFTTKPKGVGLGLSICKSIAAAHGGNLQHVRPAEGGSRFVLTLPLEMIG
jgi:two-component system sensor kinase FixL